MTEDQLVQLEALANSDPREVDRLFQNAGSEAVTVAMRPTQVLALIAEVRRLRDLVHSAWEEAYDAGQRSTEGAPKVWLSSDTRKQLGAP